MFRYAIGTVEVFDSDTGTFRKASPNAPIEFEHSLASLSLWESKWEIPFLSSPDLTSEQTLDYIKCMVVTKDIAPDLFDQVTEHDVHAISEYIGKKNSATWFNDPPQTSNNRQKITSELVYGWMVQLTIPFDPCENWNFNRLLTLIKVTNKLNTTDDKKRKMSRSELAQRNRELNAQRRAKTGSQG